MRSANIFISDNTYNVPTIKYRHPHPLPPSFIQFLEGISISPSFSFSFYSSNPLQSSLHSPEHNHFYAATLHDLHHCHYLSVHSHSPSSSSCSCSVYVLHTHSSFHNQQRHLQCVSRTHRTGKGTISNFHSSHIFIFGLLMVHNRRRIIFSNDTAIMFLQFLRGRPWAINVFFGIILQLWNPVTDEITIFIRFLAKSNGRIHPEICSKKSRGTQPHPICRIECIISIQQIFRKYFSSHFPMLPQITSRQETSHSMTSQVVHPSTTSQLSSNQNRRRCRPHELSDLVQLVRLVTSYFVF